ncbi:type 4 prepilin-like proteins leader peptide-processing enzyme [Gemmatimonadetes bacterium T265]|nr:type 4 prepilin-like proteins leader peptide-processing enzyme [Gemmatimonadetes bacterium T265]
MPAGYLPPQTSWPLLLLALVVGLALGSFLNVCIVRWPAEESVVRPPSRCPRCGREVRWYENVPFLSWLALRGRCAGCGLPIGVLYPLVELAVGLMWLGTVWVFGPTVDAVRVAVLLTVLLGIAVTDARAMVIPDGFTVFLLLFGLVGSVVSRTAGAVSLFAQPYEAFLGACAGAGLVAIIGWLGELAFKKEAMGFGDVTMMAAVGASLGPERALMTVLLGAFFGAIASVLVLVPLALLRKRTAVAAGPGGAGDDAESTGSLFGDLPHVPFGVFLAPGAVVALFYGDRIIAWYFTRVLVNT